MVGPLTDVAAAGGYVAVPTDAVQVYPVAGGVPVAIPGMHPRFERGVAQPLLLLRTWSANATPRSGRAIAATDGTAAVTPAVPDFVSFATWLGSAAVYGIVPDTGQPVTISALTNADAVTTLLASEVESYAWAAIAAPLPFAADGGRRRSGRAVLRRPSPLTRQTASD
jgi:hypothetical protein